MTPGRARAAARRRAAFAGIALACAVLLAAACGRVPVGGTVVIRGGSVLDGTGAPAFVADVVIEDGRVVAVGTAPRGHGGREIDARGLVVAPGFIDAHSHADLILLADRPTRERLLEAKIRQGVTTVVVGNCGLGPAPATPGAATILAGVNAWMTPAGVMPGPLDVTGYLARLDRDPPPVNVATLVPHGPLRISAAGLVPGAPGAAALAAMKDELDRALEAGAAGISFGLIYPPGMYADTGELTALAAVAAGRDRVVTIHVRGSSETLLDATRELVEVAETTGARVHHSHLEAVGEPFWSLVPEVLRIEDEARARGLRVSHDVFPYTRAATMMAAVFPPWALEGGVARLVERLQDPGERAAIRRDIETVRPEWPPWREGGWPHNLAGAVGWDGIVVANVPEGSPDVGAVGLSIAAVAAHAGIEPFDALADLMIRNGGRVGQQVLEISGDDAGGGVLATIVAHPAGLIVSDAEDYGRGTPHPAHAGAFARALRLAREGVGPPLAETVRRTTSAPASLFGLGGRGRLVAGQAADVVIFDPRSATDRATWQAPRRHADGIRWVLVGGSVVVEDGAFLGGSAGRALRVGRGP